MFLLAQDVSRAAGNVPESLAKWRTGKRIEVILNTGDKLIGRLGSIDSDRFTLAPDKRKGTARVLQFDEVRAVRSKLTTTQKWAIAGGVYAVFFVMGLVVGD
jgi:hypothetical protein